MSFSLIIEFELSDLRFPLIFLINSHHKICGVRVIINFVILEDFNQLQKGICVINIL